MIRPARSRSRLITLLMFTMATAASPGVEDHNGHWWRRQTEGIKVGYVIGCMDHVNVANPNWAQGVTFERVPSFNEVCDRLDLFYSEPNNRAVALQVAVPTVLLQIAKAQSAATHKRSP
jgi:hypothetical protein